MFKPESSLKLKDEVYPKAASNDSSELFSLAFPAKKAIKE